MISLCERCKNSNICKYVGNLSLVEKEIEKAIKGSPEIFAIDYKCKGFEKIKAREPMVSGLEGY